MSVEPRSLAVQLSPPSTPSPPPEEEEENEDYHKDLWVSLQITTNNLFHQFTEIISERTEVWMLCMQ